MGHWNYRIIETIGIFDTANTGYWNYRNIGHWNYRDIEIIEMWKTETRGYYRNIGGGTISILDAISIKTIDTGNIGIVEL
ncbi:hypothetical protein CEXT_69681 [Caerostris extrusa]|uniref:Uncharacterized protein n=1 Tax=Caerostris extrusa TaxID=172846 RepID=A0AAV4Q4B7_CAEEX|nr:hypothetical protein CEXT_69681 [Caerostris extrusa]